jgi:hypothetical protein
LQLRFERTDAVLLIPAIWRRRQPAKPIDHLRLLRGSGR